MDTKIPDPPQAPPELSAGAPPADATADATADAGTTPPPPSSGYTPEQIERAALSYANLTGQGFNFVLERQGRTPLTPSESAGWVDCWRRECQARPILIKWSESGYVPPELTMLFFVFGVLQVRKKAEQEEAAKTTEPQREAGDGP